MSCEVFDDSAAELALGLLSGMERAATVDHVATCRACGGLLRDLTDVADTLALTAPEADPPAGFATRVLARLTQAAGGGLAGPAGPEPAGLGGLGPAGLGGLGPGLAGSGLAPMGPAPVAAENPTAPHRAGARVVALAAAAVAFAVGAGVVAAAGQVARSHQATTATAPVFDSYGRGVGAALVVSGRRAFIGFDITTDQPDQTYRVVVEETRGRRLPAGTVTSVGRTCVWSWLLPVPSSQLVGLQMLPVTGYGAGYSALFTHEG